MSIPSLSSVAVEQTIVDQSKVKGKAPGPENVVLGEVAQQALQDMQALRVFQANKLTREEKLAKNLELAKLQDKQEVRKGEKSFKLLPLDLERWPEAMSPKLISIARREDFQYGEIVGGAAAAKGYRSTMEDTHLCGVFSFRSNSVEQSFCLWAVFDGHGGEECSTFLRENFATYLTNAFESCCAASISDEACGDALKKCFENLDAGFTKRKSGSTAIVSILLNGNIWTACVGDSRAAIGGKAGAFSLSQDAKPNVKRFKYEIEVKKGAVVSFIANAYRVQGQISLARALGNNSLTTNGGEKILSAVPKITKVALSDFEDETVYLALACDGLFDMATSSQVIEAVCSLDGVGDSCGQIAQKIAMRAIASGSTDNISLIVLKLPGGGGGS